MLPNAAIVASAADFKDLELATLQTTVAVFPVTVAAATVSASALMSAMTTFAFAWVKRLVSARPMPEAAPVMKTVLPAMFFMFVSFVYRNFMAEAVRVRSVPLRSASG